MNEQIIRDFLNASGFSEKGKDQFYREGTGTIFIRQYDVTKVMFHIMELGRKHHAKEIRDILYFKDAVEVCVFNPQV